MSSIQSYFDIVRIGKDGKIEWSLAQQEADNKALFISADTVIISK